MISAGRRVPYARQCRTTKRSSIVCQSHKHILLPNGLTIRSAAGGVECLVAARAAALMLLDAD
jgi:hypothetical protein